MHHVGAVGTTRCYVKHHMRSLSCLLMACCNRIVKTIGMQAQYKQSLTVSLFAGNPKQVEQYQGGGTYFPGPSLIVVLWTDGARECDNVILSALPPSS